MSLAEEPARVSSLSVTQPVLASALTASYAPGTSGCRCGPPPMRSGCRSDHITRTAPPVACNQGRNAFVLGGRYGRTGVPLDELRPHHAPARRCVRRHRFAAADADNDARLADDHQARRWLARQCSLELACLMTSSTADRSPMLGADWQRRPRWSSRYAGAAVSAVGISSSGSARARLRSCNCEAPS